MFKLKISVLLPLLHVASYGQTKINFIINLFQKCFTTCLHLFTNFLLFQNMIGSKPYCSGKTDFHHQWQHRRDSRSISPVINAMEAKLRSKINSMGCTSVLKKDQCAYIIGRMVQKKYYIYFIVAESESRSAEFSKKTRALTALSIRVLYTILSLSVFYRF